MTRRPMAHREESRLTRFGYRLAIVALVLLVFLAWSAVDQDQMTVLADRRGCGAVKQDALTFRSFDGRGTARLAQGAGVVVIQIDDQHGGYASLLLRPDEADAMARSLRRRARYAREAAA